MQFIREKLSCPFSKKAESSIFGALENEFSPVVAGGRREFLKELHLGIDSSCEDLSGDLFVSPDGTLCFYKISPDHKGIMAGAAWNDESGRGYWDKFRGILSSISGKSDWQAAPILSSRFVMLLEECQLLDAGEWERKAAIVLQRPQLRRLVKIINSKVNISLQAASEGRPLKEVGAEVQEMEEMGVINREFQVFCRETHQMVTCVSSLAALDDASGRGFKCFHCGRSISEEQIVQTLGITLQGQRLAQPNMWLAIMVGAELIDLGVDPNRIVYRSEDNFKTVEVFADVLGSLFMFSIQEDGVTPDSAFRFLSRTHFFKPDFGFIVTPRAANCESLAVLNNGENLCVVDNMADLGRLLKEAIEKSSKHVISELLEGFSGKTELCIGDIIGNYYFGPEAKKEVIEPEAQEELPAVLLETAQPEEQLEVAQVEEPLEIIEEPSVISEPEIAEREEVSEIPAEEILDIPENIEAAEIELAEEKAEPEQPEEPLTAEAEQVEASAEVAVEQELPAEEIVLDEQPASEFSETPCDSSVFAEMSEAISEIMAQIPEIYESNDPDSVAALLEQFSAVEGASAMLADSEGSPFAGSMETCDDPDMAAALQCDLVAGVSANLSDAGLGALKHVYICGRPGTIGVYYSADEGLNLVVHSVYELQNEVVAHDAGGRKRRDAFRYVLSEIRALPGVAGAIIAKSDGSVHEADMPFDIDTIEHIAAAAGHILSESAAEFADNMGYAPVVGIIVGTDEAAYSIIPLGMNFVLITQMEPGANEQLWRVSIPARAGVAFSVLG